MIKMKVAETEKPVEMRVYEGVGTVPVREGSISYESLPDKPKLNGVTLLSDTSLEEIGIEPIPLSEIAQMFKDW